MDSTTVHKKLLRKELKIKTVSAKSEVWKTFGIVSDLNGVECNFVACKHCSRVLIYKKNVTGTSSMKKHTCNLLGQPVLTSPAIKVFAQSTTATPSTVTKDRITAACVSFCAEDLRPFDLVAGNGYLAHLDVVSLHNICFCSRD